MMKPTTEQQRIIDEPSNCVVIAKPGSGKTFTISRKITEISPTIHPFQGVIAISYTNKASQELENRCRRAGASTINSTFSTIDSFLISHIIRPFGIHVFGRPAVNVQIVQADDLEQEQVNLSLIKRLQRVSDVSEAHHSIFQKWFLGGKIVLESLGLLANYILRQSVACRRYLTARFSHVFIDEYQDCDVWQHQVFLKLVQIGLVGVAVGDMDQSIFAFANKSSKYLASLAGMPQFATHRLTTNHRCHPSIINYSTRLISANYDNLDVDEIRVFHSNIEGCEIEIAQWIDSAIPDILATYDIEALNKVGILVKNSLTQNIIRDHLQTPHKVFSVTELDSDSSLWGMLFRRILIWAFSEEITKYELVEQYFEMDDRNVQSIMNHLREIEAVASDNRGLLIDQIDTFAAIATIIFPSAHSTTAMRKLRNILRTSRLLESYVPASPDQVQLLTLHKSKGLEFDIVFHLNLYKWVLPQYKGNYSQDINLHYVGITRAKECCVLVSSTQRSFGRYGQQQQKDAAVSDFLSRDGLSKLRLDCPFGD